MAAGWITTQHAILLAVRHRARKPLEEMVVGARRHPVAATCNMTHIVNAFRQHPDAGTFHTWLAKRRQVWTRLQAVADAQ